MALFDEEPPGNWPKQGPLLRHWVRVLLAGDDTPRLGRVVRDDAQGDLVLLIQLVDGRVVLGNECVFETYAPVFA